MTIEISEVGKAQDSMKEILAKFKEDRDYLKWKIESKPYLKILNDDAKKIADSFKMEYKEIKFESIIKNY